MSMLKTGRPSKERKDKAIASVQKLDETVRMNINVPKTFYKLIKQRALDQEITITELVVQALKEDIDE
jgi:hypothetical protein